MVVVLEGTAQRDGEGESENGQMGRVVRDGSKLGKAKLLGKKLQMKKQINEPNFGGIFNQAMGRALRYGRDPWLPFSGPDLSLWP